MPGLNNTIINQQNFKKSPVLANKEVVSEVRSQVMKKNFLYIEFLSPEYPKYMLKFLPRGVLEIYGANPKSPIKHSYSLIHRGENTFMVTSPDLMVTPGEMKVIMKIGQLTLISVKDPTEIIHLRSSKMKG